MSKLLKTKPRQMATPGSGANKDLQAAQMAERLLEFWWDDFQLDDKLAEAITWARIAGQGYWKVCWDPHAGRQMSFLLGPDGNPILDEPLKDAFTAQLQQVGLQPEETVVYMGDISVEVVSPFDLLVDPNVKNFHEAKWAFHTSTLDTDTIRVRYKKDLPPDSVPVAPDSSPVREDTPTVRRVVTGYFCPSPAMPNGRIVTWSKDQILEDQAWYYPTHELPFVKYGGVRIPGEVYDTSEVEQAIPIQKELNRTLSQIVEHKNLNVKNQWIAPVGSLRQRRTDEPGAIFEYSPVGGLKPEPIEVTSLPAYVFEHLNNLKARLDDIFGKTEVTEGSVPPNVEAGVAIDLLQEMATDRLAPAIRSIEMSLARSGQMMLGLARKYYIEPRMLKIRGSAGSYQAKQFTNTDIDGAISVVVEAGSGLPRTRAGRLARIQQFVEMGVLRPDQAYKHLDLADMHGLQEQFALDEDQAYREHEKLNTGAILNPLALQAAQGAIEQAMQDGVNPESQEPFHDEQEFMAWAEQTMQSAAMAPGPADNHVVHVDVHGRFIKSVEFERVDPQIQQAYVTHWQAHQQALAQAPQPEPQAPNINLQLKSTVGPTTQSKILQQAGIDATPEEASEPPLETWVSDSVDKADVDGGGPGQDGGVNLMKVAQINAEAQANALATAHQSQQSSMKSEADLVDRARKAQQDGELHQERLRAAAAQADAAVKNARVAGQKPQGGKSGSSKSRK